MAIDNKTLDALMHAFLDGQLSPNATKKVVKYLKEHPSRNEELKQNKKIKTYIHGAYNPILELPISDRLKSVLFNEQKVLTTSTGTSINIDEMDFNLGGSDSPDSVATKKNAKNSSRPLSEIFSAGIHSHSGHIVIVSALVFMMGLMIGYLYPNSSDPEKFSKDEFAENLALSAHLTYASESNFSIQAKPDQIDEFSAKYSEKIGADISPVKLKQIGLELMGGQILPSLNEKAVFYMYQSVSNERLSLYIRRHFKQTGVSAYYCFASLSDRVNVCSWRGKLLTYYVVSDQPADTMEAIVDDISKTLNN